MISRRDVLVLGAGAAAGVAVGSSPARAADTPKRGGVLRFCGDGDPVGFDPHLTQSYRTMIHLSLTHSRLLKVKAGPSVRPGTLPIEADLAESWSQPSPTSYLFRLRRGARWHPKAPVNGRELTADDVKYTYERFLGTKGNPNRGALELVESIDTPDKYTVKFTLREPYAWFLDALASPSTWIVARECVEKFGDLKRAEANVGTGPWILERWEPNTRLTYVRNPNYFVPGLPYADGVDVTIDADPSSRLASWLAGRYDFAPESFQVLRRLDLDVAKQRKPGLQVAEMIVGFGGITWMKLDQAPFTDVRVRRALAMAGNWREILETNAWSQGHGVPNPAVPAAFREWSMPIDQLPPEGQRLYAHDVAEAKRLLAQAGFGAGLKLPLDVTPGYGPDYIDAVQVALRNWKDVGVDVELRLKEYGAYISTTIFGRFEKMAGGLFGAWTDPDSYLFRYHTPGQITNASGVNDPKLNDMIKAERRTFDATKRRDIMWDVQRYLAQQCYHLYGPSVTALVAWEPYVKNYGPNIGFDYGGRLMGVWLDR